MLGCSGTRLRCQIGPCVAHRTPAVVAQAVSIKGRQTGSSTPRETVTGSSTRKPSQSLKGTAKITTSSRTAAQTRGKQPKQEGNRQTGSRFYNFITGFPFPLGPFLFRNTVRREVARGVWVFEQTQALEWFSLYTPVRMTVIQLETGGLWVHAPVAPTDECVRLVRELGVVEYIVHPTFAYEHKAFVGPFSRSFPKAKVYVAPHQWSFPLNLPPQFFGIFPEGELQSDDPTVPWADEIEQKLFLPPSIGVSNYVRFSEVAFFHKRSRTLLVTDAVVFVGDTPPEIIPVDALLENARDNALNRFVAGDLTSEEVKQIARPEPVEDTPQNRRKGWMRMALLVLYLGPSNLLEAEESFQAISNRVMVAPVVETLVYNKCPASVRRWVDEICCWDFRQIIPCHFEAPIKAGPAEFKRAFTFVYQGLEQEDFAPAASGPAGLLASFVSLVTGGGGKPQKLTRPVDFPPADMRTLNGINNSLLRLGVVKANADA